MPLTALVFEITLHDGAGNSWDHGFQVALGSTGAKVEVDHVELLEDGNADGNVNPGESAKVAVYVANHGTSKALDVWAKVTEPANYVWNMKQYGHYNQYSNYDELAPGGVANLVQVEFLVDDEAPLTPLVFEVTLWDGAGNNWGLAFVIELSPSGAKLEVDHVTLLEDENDDGQVNPGESAKVAVHVVNKGTSKALDVWAKVTEPTNYVWNMKVNGYHNQYSNFDELKPWVVVDLVQVDFNVDENAPLTPLNFQISLNDGAGNSWDELFEVNLAATGAALGVQAVELINDENGDGKVSPGENAKVAVYVINTGTSDALDLWAKVTHETPYVWNVKKHGYYNQYSTYDVLAPGAVINLVQVEFSLDDDAPLVPLTFEVTLHDGAGNSWQDQFQVGVTQ